jgi:thiosulfate reductase/polysulfide reductase chain A
MNHLSRRKFLKITGAAASAAAAMSAVGCSTSTAPSNRNEKGIRTVPTLCDICFWKCGAIAYVKDGTLWKVEGNPLDPLSNGRLCPRGTGGVGAHFDPDRLRSPLLRARLRGEERWVAETWDEALGQIAEKMQRIKAEYGPETMALFSHGIGGNFLKHTLKAYGSPNIAAPSFAQCRGPRDVGFRLTFGEDVSSPERTDIRTRCLVLIGSHLRKYAQHTGRSSPRSRTGATLLSSIRASPRRRKSEHYRRSGPDDSPFSWHG